MCGPLRPDYLVYPYIAPTPATLGPLGPDYYNGSQGYMAPKCRDRDMEEGRGDSNTIIKFSLEYQTKVGLYVVAQTPSPNVYNFGVAHPSPGGTRMTTYIPSKALPRPSTLVGHNFPPTP